jgi:hypothetical protein
LHSIYSYDKLNEVSNRNDYKKIHPACIGSAFGLHQQSLAGIMPGEQRLCGSYSANVHEKDVLYNQRAVQRNHTPETGGQAGY